MDAARRRLNCTFVYLTETSKNGFGTVWDISVLELSENIPQGTAQSVKELLQAPKGDALLCVFQAISSFSIWVGGLFLTWVRVEFSVVL